MKLILDRKDEEAFEHLVPLSRQAVAVLRAMRKLMGRNKLVSVAAPRPSAYERERDRLSL